MNSMNSCSGITLNEAIIKYYEGNPEFKGGGEFLGMSGEIVKEHDVVHVVFGLRNTSREELLIEVITLFGCKMSPHHYQESLSGGFFLEVLKTFGPLRLFTRLILTIPDVTKTILMCLRLKKKWPHSGYHLYLETPLSEIRNEFGIPV